MKRVAFHVEASGSSLSATLIGTGSAAMQSGLRRPVRIIIDGASAEE